jgi:hypothetical protein
MRLHDFHVEVVTQDAGRTSASLNTAFTPTAKLGDMAIGILRPACRIAFSADRETRWCR